MEISQANIHNSSVETKTKLVNDIMRLLQVREKNSEMAKDWLLFVTTTPRFQALTPGEIYQAFKLAMSRELLDVDGKEFNLLPDLSINLTSKLLIAYIAYKKHNPEYISAREQLKLNAKKGVTEEQKQRIREEFILSVFNDIVEKEHCEEAWLLYDELVDVIPQTIEQKKNLYKQQEHIYLSELKQDVAKNNGRVKYKEIFEQAQERKAAGKYLAVVQNRCRAIMVSNYLKHFKKDIEQFKKAINENKRASENSAETLVSKE